MAKKEEVKKEEATPVVANASGESNDATATSTDGSNTQPQKIYATNPFYEDNWMTQAKQSQSQPQQPQAQPQQPTQKVDEFEQLQSEYNKKVQGVTDAVNEAKREQDAERAKEAKRQRNRQIINSIADGISAIANLGGTVHGAPDMSAKSTLTGKSAERYDKIYKDAEERRKAYLKVVQDQGNESVKNWYTMQKDKLKAKQDAEKFELQKNKDARDEIKAEVEAEKARLYLDYLQGRIDEQEWKTKTAEAEAKNAPTYYENRAKKAGYIAPRGNGGGSKGGGAGNYSAYSADGKLHFFKSKSDAQQFAMNEGTWENSRTSGDKENRTTTPGYSKDPKKGPVPTGEKGEKWNKKSN